MSPYPVEPARSAGPMRIVVTTYPSPESADAAVDSALTAKLAACANVVLVRSRYWWNGKVESANEALVLYKTAPKRVGALFRHIETTHPYDVPEIVELDVPRVGNAYLRYLLDTVEPGASLPRAHRPSRRRGARRGREARAPARTRAPRRHRSR